MAVCLRAYTAALMQRIMLTCRHVATYAHATWHTNVCAIDEAIYAVVENTQSSVKHNL